MDSQHTVGERVSSVLTATIKDNTGTPIPGASLETLTVTLYEVLTGSIINGRNDTNILGANGGSVSVGGVLTWNMDAADNQILSATSPPVTDERHVALIEFTFNGGRRGKHEALILVVASEKVP